MPYKYQTEKLKIPRTLDRRVKITEEDKEKIRGLYKEGKGVRAIAREMEGVCSRRSVQYILFPERAAIVKKQHKARRKDGRYYPGKEAWREVIREHRRYKQSIVGQLIDTQ